MSIKYLLSCSCGEKIAVETTQAGQDIQCSCGKTLAVPTMQGIRRLERFVDSSDESRAGPSYGGVAIGIALLGLILLGAGGVLMYRTHSQYTEFTQYLFMDMDYMTPWATWGMWQNFREGVRLPEYSESPYLAAKHAYRQYMTIGAVIAGVGVVMLACAGVAARLGAPRSRKTT